MRNLLEITKTNIQKERWRINRVPTGLGGLVHLPTLKGRCKKTHRRTRGREKLLCVITWTFSYHRCMVPYPKPSIWDPQRSRQPGWITASLAMCDRRTLSSEACFTRIILLPERQHGQEVARHRPARQLQPAAKAEGIKVCVSWCAFLPM